MSNDEPPYSEETTRVTCLACGGEYKILSGADGKYAMSLCRWCDVGAMTAEQIKRWSERKKP